MLYHINVYWPEHAPKRLEKVSLRYTKHAIERSFQKKIVLPGTLEHAEIFELETRDEKTVKLAVRAPYSNTHDLCLVLVQGGLVVTAWLNSKQDKHATLDRTRYVNKVA